MSGQWGQPVVVETRPGGGTVIASALVAKAPPDGHTILYTAASLVINAKLRSDLPYDGIKAFAPVAPMFHSPQVIGVNAASPYRTFKDWVADAKARPGSVSIGTVGPATSQHIAAEILQRATGTKLIYTAFGGGAPAVNAALGGHVNLVLSILPDMSALADAGKLRLLAVGTRERVATMPHVPTVAELGYPDFEEVAWFGVTAPAKTPPEVVTRLAEGIRAAIANPAIRQQVTSLGLQPEFMDQRAFAAYIDGQYAKYARVIDEAKIRPD